MRLCVSCGHGLQGAGWVCQQCGWSAGEKDGIRVLSETHEPSSVNFTPSEFEALYQLEQNYFWFRSRIQLILWAFRRYANGCASFLEIGCGTGAVLSAVAREHPDVTVWGSEAYLEGLHYARSRVDAARLMQMDARRIPFSDEFDAIGLFDVLEHIEEQQLVLEQVNRALTSGGLLLITVPQHRFLWSGSDDQAGHVRRYSRGELISNVEQSNFRVLKCTSFVSVLFPLLMASRLLRKRKRNDALAEYRLPAAVNGLLGHMLSAERAAIRAGATFPFGGSLLLVARRERKQA